MIMIVKTPGSQMGSPAAAEEGGEEVGGGTANTSGSKKERKRLKSQLGGPSMCLSLSLDELSECCYGSQTKIF